MKIFYVNVIEQNAGWGAEWFMDRALRGLGHETVCLDYRAHRPRLARRFLTPPGCDVFLLQRGEYFPLPLIRSVQAPRLFWASELVSRCRDQDRLIRSGLFDHVFFRTPQCIDAVVARGWIARERCSILLSGFDPEVFRPIPNAPKDVDVLFIGHLTPRRQAVLDQLYGREVNVTVVPAFGEEMAQWLNRAKIVLNIHAEEYADTETRVYEVLGCGAFLLSERLSAENPFGDGDLVQVASPDQFPDRIAYFLSHSEERAHIAEQGHRAALGGHTYRHRAREIVGVMSDLIAQRSASAARPSARPFGLYAYAAWESLRRLVRLGAR